MNQELELYQSDLMLVTRLLRYEIARDLEDGQPLLADEKTKVLAKVSTMLMYVRKGELKASIVPTN